MRAGAGREHESGLRPVEREAGGALAVARLQEIRVVAARPCGASSTEKIVPMVMLISMLEEPSSGSSATR